MLKRFSHLCLIAAALAAENYFTAPATLTIEGIPPIPADLVDSISRYAAARTASLMDWHPIKREILIQTRFGDTPQIHRVAMPGEART